MEEKEKVIGAVDMEEYENVHVEAIIDSGAFDTICPMEMVGGSELRQTEASCFPSRQLPAAF